MYCIDLTAKNIEVLEYTSEILKEDMEFFSVKNAMDLNDYDYKVFKTEKEADDFLNKYLKTLKTLNNNKICKSRALPCLLYKRRYIVQTLLGLKNQTFRHYQKKWKAGQLFNLHDQTYFLTVKLRKITKISKNNYKYDFKLV